MKLLDIYIISESDDEGMDGVGIKWCACAEHPLMYFPKPDRDYWSYLHIRIVFIRRAICAEIRLGKLPYRNKEEYLQWRRKKRAELNNGTNYSQH